MTSEIGGSSVHIRETISLFLALFEIQARRGRVEESEFPLNFSSRAHIVAGDPFAPGAMENLEKPPCGAEKQPICQNEQISSPYS